MSNVIPIASSNRVLEKLDSHLTDAINEFLKQHPLTTVEVVGVLTAIEHRLFLSKHLGE